MADWHLSGTYLSDVTELVHGVLEPDPALVSCSGFCIDDPVRTVLKAYSAIPGREKLTWLQLLTPL